MARNGRLRPEDVEELAERDPETALTVEQAREIAAPDNGPWGSRLGDNPFNGDSPTSNNSDTVGGGGDGL
jgi:hypothetical protein